MKKKPGDVNQNPTQISNIHAILIANMLNPEDSNLGMLINRFHKK